MKSRAKLVILLGAVLAPWSWATTKAQEPGCIEVEAILVNSCPNLQTGQNLPEGLNEMVFMRVGSESIDLSPAYLSQTPIINFPNNANHLVPPTAYTGSVVDQWRANLQYPDCAAIVEVSDQLTPPYTLPAGARVILVTSALFSADALDFSGLMDTVYLMYASNTSEQGRFSNSGNPNPRVFRFCPTPECCDEVSYISNTLSNIDGETVLFDWAGNPTPALLNCRPPVPPTIPNILSSLVDACEGTVRLRGSNVAPYSGQWFTVSVPEGATEPELSPHPDSARVTFTATVPGVYRFGRRLFLSGACQSLLEGSTQYIDVSVPERPTAEWAPFNAFICPGETAVLTPAQSEGEIEWFLNGESLGVAPEWETDVPGTYSFSRTLNGCIAESETRTLTVGTLPSTPQISVSPSQPCPGETVVFTANVEVEWFYNNSSAANGTQYSLVLDEATAGAVFARSTNECGFADSEPISLALPAPLPDNLGIGVNMQDFCSQGAVVSVVNYTPATGLRYRWFGPTTFANAYGPTQTVSAFGEYGFWASNGCDSLEFRLTISESDLPPLSVNVTPTQADICPGGGTATFVAEVTGAQEPVEYLWERNGTSVGNEASLTTGVGGNYRLTVRDGCGRIGNAVIEATLLPGVKINPEGRQTICRGETATVQLSGAQSYQWTPAPSLTVFDDGATALFSPDADQSYQCVCITGACAETLTVDVAVVLPPQLTLESEKSEIEEGDGTILRARGNAVAFYWRPSNTLSDSTGTSVVATPVASAVYTVTAVNANGCTTTDTIGVRVKPRRKVHAGLPNVFTPNGDGVNDVFPFSIPEGYEKIEVSIYERWGTRVYSIKSDVGKGDFVQWNGKNDSGADCPEGVYLFSADYYGSNRELHRTGSITLIR